MKLIYCNCCRFKIKFQFITITTSGLRNCQNKFSEASAEEDRNVIAL